MVQVITLKLTTAEIEVLDWLMSRVGVESRSQALRFALVQSANREGLSKGELMRMREERSEHLPRRTARATRHAVRTCTAETQPPPRSRRS